MTRGFLSLVLHNVIKKNDEIFTVNPHIHLETSILPQNDAK